MDYGEIEVILVNEPVVGFHVPSLDQILGSPDSTLTDEYASGHVQIVCNPRRQVFHSM